MRISDWSSDVCSSDLPSEVEAALIEHPAVVEAAVIGRPDPVRTEVAKAFVPLRPGHEPSPALAEEISLLVQKRLAAHAYTRKIDIAHTLPTTPRGKITPFILRHTHTEQTRAPDASDRRHQQISTIDE